jgi:hypothetical protein
MLATTAGSAASLPELRATTTTVSGVYAVTFNLNIASRLPAGTMITCRAQISPTHGLLDLLNQQFTSIPTGTAVGRIVVTGSTATCAAEIPFSWTVTGGPGGVMLSYEIEAVTNTGLTPLLVRRSAQQNLVAAFPATGGSSNLRLNLSF